MRMAQQPPFNNEAIYRLPALMDLTNDVADTSSASPSTSTAVLSSATPISSTPVITIETARRSHTPPPKGFFGTLLLLPSITATRTRPSTFASSAPKRSNKSSTLQEFRRFLIRSWQRLPAVGPQMRKFGRVCLAVAAVSLVFRYCSIYRWDSGPSGGDVGYLKSDHLFKSVLDEAEDSNVVLRYVPPSTPFPPMHAYKLYHAFFKAKDGFDNPKYQEYKWNLYKLLKRTELERQRGNNSTHAGSEYPKSLIGKLLFSNFTEVMCEFKKRPPFVLTNTTPPFDKNPLGHLLPHDRWILPPGKQLGTCAIVTSSGCLLKSNLGPLIDSYDQVFRLNAAPTVGFENDVGRRTTIRMLNNFELWALSNELDIRTKESERPLNFPDTKHAMLLAWDTCTHRGPYDERCLRDVQFANISKMEERDTVNSYLRWKAENPSRQMHFLNPEWVWSLGDVLQQLAPIHIRTLVPSSGFIGVGFLLHYCSEVHIFEMLPSMSDNPNKKVRCRYFQPNRYTQNPQDCSTFRGHLRQEELLALMRLNVASDEDTYGKGHAILPGLASLKC